MTAPVEPSSTTTPDRLGGPRGAALAAWWTVVVAASGAGPVAGRLGAMGPSIRRAAIVIAVASLLGAVALRWLPRLAGAAVAGVAFVVAAAITQGTVGRAPTPVAAALVVLAHLIVPWPTGSTSRPSQRVRGSDGRAGLSPLLWVLGLTWWAWGSDLVASVGIAALVGALVVDRRRPGTLACFATTGRVVAAGPARVAGRLDRSGGERGGRLGAARTGLARRVRWMRELDRGWRIAVGLALAGGLLAAPIFWRLAVDQHVLIRGINDLNSGGRRIRYMRFWPPRSGVAHPVWMATIHALLWVTSYGVATTAVSVLAIAGSVLVLVALARGRWDDRPALAWPAALALGVGWLFLESPSVFVPRGGRWWMRAEPLHRFASGTTFLPIHLWAVPTLVMSLPLAFTVPPLVLRLIRASDDGDPRARRWGQGLAAHTVLLSLLLPATTLAYVPASVAYLILTKRFRRDPIVGLGRYYVLPGALVIAGQVLYLHSKVSPYEQATWLWRPFWALHHYGMDRPACYGIVLFFLACWWVGGRRYVSEPAVALSLLALVVSLPPFLLIQQKTAAPIPDSDLAIPMCMSVLLLFVASLRFVAVELLQGPSHGNRARRAASLAAIACLVVMLAAGAWDFGAAAGWLRES